MVLPAPDGPTRATIWPGCAVKVTSCSTMLVVAGLGPGHRSPGWPATPRRRAGSGTPRGRTPRAPPSAASTTASGLSSIIEGRSSTSKTRSKLTSAVITSTRTFERPCSGPSRRSSRVASASRVPTVRVPEMTRAPPTPYTSAVARAGMSMSVALKTRVISAMRTPRSRTRPALLANWSSSSARRPNSLSSMAPPTLNRSVIELPISALPCIWSRVRPTSCRPTQRLASSRSGKVSRHSTVTCQLSASISTPTTTTPMTLETVLDSTEVKARCAPMTSLLSRETRAPVCVRVKKARDIRCTWAKTLVRRS